MTKRVAVLWIAAVVVATMALGAFGVQPTVQSIILCKDVDRSAYRPIGQTSAFSGSDSAVWCFAEIATPDDTRLEFRWYAPDGTLYHTTKFGLLYGPSRPDGSSGWYVYDSLDIAGTPVASMSGTWKVEVVLRPGRDKTKTFTSAGRNRSPSQVSRVEAALRPHDRHLEGIVFSFPMISATPEAGGVPTRVRGGTTAIRTVRTT